MNRRLFVVSLLIALLAPAVFFVCRRLRARTAVSEIPEERADGTPSGAPVPWPTLARRLAEDLALDERQANAVAEALQECDNALRAASEETDPKLHHIKFERARQRAFVKIRHTLDKEKRKLLERWVTDPKRTDILAWLAPTVGCCTEARRPSPPGGSTTSGRREDASAFSELLESRGASRLLEAWLFYFPNCRRCRQARRALEGLAAEREKEVEVRVFNAVAEPESVSLAFGVLDMYPDAPDEIPGAVAFIGDEMLLGPDEIISHLSDVIAVQLKRGGEHLQVRRPREIVPFTERAFPLRLVPVVLAGLADGVNPCAFAAMVLLISVLSVGRFSSEGGRSGPGELLLGGAAFCTGVFVTYYLAGLALFAGVTHLEGFYVAEMVVFWIVWTLALAGGVASAVDAVVYLRTGDPSRVRLKVPERLRRLFAPLLRARFRRSGLLLGGLVGGVLIAILEGVCTGQMYLPTIQYMARTPGLRARGAAYLLLYNGLFIVPLLAILGVALAGVHFRRLNAFLQRHLGAAKLGLAVVFFLLAAVMILGR